MYKTYILRGLLKAVYKFLYGVRISIGPKKYEETNIFRVIISLLDNFKIIHKYLGVEITIIDKDFEENSREFKNLFHKNKRLGSNKEGYSFLLRVLGYIIKLYDKFPEFQNEIKCYYRNTEPEPGHNHAKKYDGLEVLD